MTNNPAPLPATAHLRLAEAIIAPPLGLTRAPRYIASMPDIMDDPDFDLFNDDEEDDSDCEGHADGPVMGETFYCDGSCS